MNTRIEYPTTLTALQRLIKKDNLIYLDELDTPISLKNNSTHTVFINTTKIRDFHAFYKSGSNGVLGLHMKLQQLLLSESTNQNTLSPLLQHCIKHSFYLDSWNISLSKAILESHTPSLLTLFLAMIHAQIQIIQERLYWKSIRDLMTQDNIITIGNFIPIKIRMEIFTDTHYVLSCPSYPSNITTIPIYTQPIIMGELILNTNRTHVKNIYALYCYQSTLIYLNKFVQQCIGMPFPISLEEILVIWKQITQHATILPAKHKKYLLQSLIELLAPNLG